LKRVPDEAIDKMYSRFETQKIPAGIKVLKPDELDTICYRPTNLSEYKKVHVIGDIHGCYTALMEYLDSNGGFKEDEYYIFTGDYIDRGIENVEVVNFLCKQCKYKNVFFLEGNHERWLWMWANDTIAKSKEFEFITKPQLNKADVSKKEVREFYRRLGQCCYFIYNKQYFLATHGGISNIPYRDFVFQNDLDMFLDVDLLTIPTSQMINGVGRYEDVDSVDKAFCENTRLMSRRSNFYQIHGHRNVANSPVQSADRAFNLECAVERGGYLRAIQITNDGIETFEIKNNVFKDLNSSDNNNEAINVDNIDMSVYSLVESMRNNNNIYEKHFGRVSSFNFTRQAFENKAWDSIVNKARGLYIDTVDYKVVARAYDKFFNIGERPETQFNNLRYKLQFPVTAYVKENGFLGIVGWNPEVDDLLITSKSDPTGIFSTYLRNALYNIYGTETMNKIKDYVKEHEVSFVFECCDMVNDPHIIEYPKSKVVLLDIIYNKINYEKVAYHKVVEIAEEFGLAVKERAYEILSWEDFFKWYNEVTDKDYKYNGEYIEGFVIEDSVGYMTKLKLHYYTLWKKLRGVAQSVLKYGNYKYTGSLLTPLENKFFGWCKSLYDTLPADERGRLRDNSYTNICSLRKMFFDWNEQHDKEEQ
jgi:hypothetical protein